MMSFGHVAVMDSDYHKFMIGSFNQQAARADVIETNLWCQSNRRAPIPEFWFIVTVLSLNGENEKAALSC